jgi:hypothetical protein
MLQIRFSEHFFSLHSFQDDGHTVLLVRHGGTEEAPIGTEVGVVVPGGAHPEPLISGLRTEHGKANTFFDGEKNVFLGRRKQEGIVSVNKCCRAE